MGADNNGFPIDIPLLKPLGMHCLKVADDEGVVELALEVERMNSWEMAHGSATMAMLDVAMTMVGRSADVHGRGVVTIEMKAASMQSGRGILKASAHCMHQSTTMAFCGGKVRDADDKLATHGSGTFRFVKHMSSPRTPEPGADGWSDNPTVAVLTYLVAHRTTSGTQEEQPRRQPYNKLRCRRRPSLPSLHFTARD